MEGIYWLLKKEGILYRTMSWLYREIAITFLGYQVRGSRKIDYPKSSGTKLLPRLSKEELAKYKVLLRLTK